MYVLPLSFLFVILVMLWLLIQSIAGTISTWILKYPVSAWSHPYIEDYSVKNSWSVTIQSILGEFLGAHP